MAYTRLEDADVHALWVYVSRQPPVRSDVPPHEIRGRYRLPGLLGVWRRFAFHRGPDRPDPDRSPEWNRGRYLVRAVGYCDQCHTPRGRLGFLQQRRYLAGGANPGKSEVHPNLTPDPEHGIAGWSRDDLVRFLASGEKPDGGRADPNEVMDEKIHDSYSWFSAEDRAAIAVYLLALPPVDFDPERWAERFDQGSGG
jgi:mono/diheme cytochrome c family protein